MKIPGTTAVITGAASGIGHATAEELANRGAKAIAMVDITDTVGGVTEEMNRRVGREVGKAFQGDVTDEAFRKEVYDTMCAEHEFVNICVPSAGICARWAPRPLRDFATRASGPPRRPA